MKRIMMALACVTLLVAPASAQSLKPNDPAPLKAGVNDSTTDNFTGTHYWYFYGNPGTSIVHVAFKAGSVLGAATNSQLTFTLSDSAGTWHTSKALSSNADAAGREYSFTGHIKKRTKIIVTVAPVTGGLVRMGGEYQITASGDVAFGAEKAGDPIVQTFTQFSGMTSNYGATKFKADGTVLASTGATGTWKLFDADSHTYVVVLDGQTKSLVYKPGIGLVDSADPSTIVFKAIP